MHELESTHKEECLSQLLEEPQAAMLVALEDLCDKGVLSAYRVGESVTYGISEKYTKLLNTNSACFIKYDNILSNNFYSNQHKISNCFYLKEKGRTLEACTVLFSCIDRFLEKSNSFAAVTSLGLGIRYLQHWVNKYHDKNETSKFLELVLYASDITMYLSKHFTPMLELLSAAKNIALHVGEFPAATLLSIVEACLENMRAECSVERLHQLRQHLQQFIKEFGSTEYASLAQLFSGMFNFWEGDFQNTLDSFMNGNDEGYRNFDIWKGRFQSEMFSLYTSSSALYLNRFHQSVGILEAARRSASLNNHRFKTMWWEAQLAMVLLYMNKNEEALELINNVIHEADPKSETKIFFWAMRGLAYYHWKKGRIEFAYKIFSEALSICQRYSIKRVIYSYPWMLDMLYSFISTGMMPIQGISFDEELSRALNGTNRHLQASALRTLATLLIERNASINETLSYLRQSEGLFRKVGNQFESARTGLFIARCLDAIHENDESNNIRRDSFNTLSSLGQTDAHYANNIIINNTISKEKNDYSNLLKDLPRTLYFIENNNLVEISLHDIDSQTNDFESASHLSEHDSLDNCRFAFESLPPWSNYHQFLSHVVHIACSELGAERALLAQLQKDGKLEIKATSNISSKELETGVLTSYLASICQKIRRDPMFLEKNGVVSLSIPLIMGGRDFWILYIESVYAVNFLKNINKKHYKEISLIFSRELRSAFRHADTKLVDQFAPNFTPSFFRTDNSESIVYESQIMRKLISRARQVAITEAPILILGETGVGKELLAQYIHNSSGRPGNFVSVHPASNAENLFESEFFGHEKGAFTSAHRKKIGMVELAHNGTLFIDEVGDIPMAVQTKLLRVFQDHRFWRVGGDSPIDSNFRLVGATNKDLWKEVQAGRFRKDLYYRMAVIPLTIPPLRERKEDIPVLAKLFLSRFSNFYAKNISYPEEIILKKFYNYDWPGNIREMKSIIERAVILYREHDQNFEMLFLDDEHGNYPNAIENNESAKSIHSNNIISDFPTLDVLEARYIKYVLDMTNGKISGKNGALDILGMKRSTFYSKIKNSTFETAIRVTEKEICRE